jgi:hypothetical protein
MLLLTHFLPRTSARSFAEYYFVDRARARLFAACTHIFTITNSFTDFFWIKLARDVTENFLPHILSGSFETKMEHASTTVIEKKKKKKF